MPTNPSIPAWDVLALSNQLQTVASQSQSLMQRFLSRQQGWGQIGLGDSSAIGGAFVDLMTKMARDPTTLATAQIDLFNESMKIWRQSGGSHAEEPRRGRFVGTSGQAVQAFGLDRQRHVQLHQRELSGRRQVHSVERPRREGSGARTPPKRRTFTLANLSTLFPHRTSSRPIRRSSGEQSRQVARIYCAGSKIC